MDPEINPNHIWAVKSVYILTIITLLFNTANNHDKCPKFFLKYRHFLLQFF